VQVPPLRDRPGDIPLLAHHFMFRTCEEMDREPCELSPEALAYLGARQWPGNVRELQNFVRRLSVFCSGSGVVDMALVRFVESQTSDSSGTGQGAPSVSPYKEAKAAVVDDFTRAYVENLLTVTSGNVSEAARISGLSRVALQKIIKRLGVGVARFR
jgi:DNA-binding NtrC family response regulator